MSVEVNGIAHVQLTVNDPARCVPFWEKLCHFLGMQTLIRGEDVDAIHRFLVAELDARIVHLPEDGQFAPGYYSVLFEDPDGIRVEVNHVPGKGHLGPGGRLGPGGAGPARRQGDEGLEGGAAAIAEQETSAWSSPR